MVPGQISTTADMWSADTTKAAFLGVTGYWIKVKKETRKETWEMHLEVIRFWTVSGDHGGKNLGCYFMGVSNQIGITSAVISKVSFSLSWLIDAYDSYHSSTPSPLTMPQATPQNAKPFKLPQMKESSNMVYAWEPTSVMFPSWLVDYCLIHQYSCLGHVVNLAEVDVMSHIMKIAGVETATAIWEYDPSLPDNHVLNGSLDIIAAIQTLVIKVCCI